MKEEREEDERELCLEMKRGVKRRELKCLQVDRRLMKFFRGKKERTRSRR